MKESYIEILARNNGPESCVDDPRGRGKALTGESIGRAIELRNHLFSEADPVGCRVRQHGLSRKSRVANRSGGVRELGMCGHSPCGNRDISGRSLVE